MGHGGDKAIPRGMLYNPSSKEPKTKKLGETQETRARPRSSRCVVVVGNKRRGRVPVNGTETELSSAVKHGGPVPRPTASDSPSAEMLITRRPAEVSTEQEWRCMSKGVRVID
ncbi:hypothetical protein FB45DRAFT_872731 [Roridomyces roridus]|uniref:Uncharacterized protein n=1 Tax=Roridomyces roridus TaxID=1738132 RepID=A0AAD7BD11_9AGAR|nr:hypothetical protein FB45DRAFT_872731 [Roridomyces roridus]